jgi:hypothetical protein
MEKLLGLVRSLANLRRLFMSIKNLVLSKLLEDNIPNIKGAMLSWNYRLATLLVFEAGPRALLRASNSALKYPFAFSALSQKLMIV